ncbi:MAG: tetratricopeptide repeat protein [Microscillaceae bacterium]|nr:tetratricopeptide repeat protein [Microscillaceae bacterium]
MMKSIKHLLFFTRPSLNTFQKIALTALLFALLGSADLYAQGGMLDKLKQKSEEKAKQKTNQGKQNLREKAKSALDQRLEEIRADYDSSTFSFAIAFSDNAGLFEDKERAKKMQRTLISMTDASGLTKDQSTDPLKQAKTYLELGQFSYANNKFKRAEYFFKQSQREFESQGNLQNLYYPKLLTNFGLLYQTMGRYAEAIDYTQKGLALRAQTEGENSTNYAVSLNNLAMLYRSLGQYNEAEANLDQALKIIEKPKPAKAPPTPSCSTTRACSTKALDATPRPKLCSKKPPKRPKKLCAKTPIITSECWSIWPCFIKTKNATKRPKAFITVPSRSKKDDWATATTPTWPTCSISWLRFM